MKHRTAIVTAASIAVVIAAATAAIATNLGILDTATASSDIGVLTIETIETVPPTSVTVPETPPAKIVVVEDASPANSDELSDPASTDELAVYAVGDAGIVTLSNDGTTLTIVELETSAGWSTIQILDGTSVEIGFASSDGGALEFIAHIDESGEIATVVNDLAAPATVVVTETVYEDGTSATNNSESSGSSYDDDDEYDDDEDEDEDDDDDDHDDDDDDDEEEDEDEDEDDDEDDD